VAPALAPVADDDVRVRVDDVGRDLRVDIKSSTRLQCERIDASSSALLRELDESDRFVQKSAESTSM
jgi:hypothetical protein